MRTDLNSGGFTLYEILFSNTIVGIKTGLLFVSLSSLLGLFVYINTAVVLLSALSALPLEAPSFSKLRITAQKPWSVRLYVSDRLKF